MASQLIIQDYSYLDAPKYIDDKTIIITDPPFNIKYHYKTYQDNKKNEEYWEDLAKLFFALSFWSNHVS